MIRNATPKDAQAITEIYNHYVRTSTATIDVEPKEPEYFTHRIAEVQTTHPWVVFEGNDENIWGYAYGVQLKPRKAYARSCEISVYLHPEASGRGVGTRLYTALIEALKKQDIHAIIGGVSLPNEASVRLHEKLGFRKVAHFEQVGFKFGKWIDVGYWQLIVD